MKKIPVILIIAMLVSFPVFADGNEPNVDEQSVNKALTVVVDCLSAAIATNYSSSNLTLPSTSVSTTPETNLPSRIAFFLADPSIFVSTMQNVVGNTNQNLFVSLMSLITKSVTDPLVSAVYFAMASREYRQSDYLVSGVVSLSYPENADLDELTDIWINRKKTDDSIGLSMDLSIFGNSLDTSVDITGDFEIRVDEKGFMVISSKETYSVNGFCYTGGIFRF